MKLNRSGVAHLKHVMAIDFQISQICKLAADAAHTSLERNNYAPYANMEAALEIAVLTIQTQTGVTIDAGVVDAARETMNLACILMNERAAMESEAAGVIFIKG